MRSCKRRIGKIAKCSVNDALVVTGDNDVAHNNLGYLFLQRRELDSARSQYETALKIRARTDAPYYNFGGALIEKVLPLFSPKKASSMNRSAIMTRQ